MQDRRNSLKQVLEKLLRVEQCIELEIEKKNVTHLEELILQEQKWVALAGFYALQVPEPTPQELEKAQQLMQRNRKRMRQQLEGIRKELRDIQPLPSRRSPFRAPSPQMLDITG